MKLTLWFEKKTINLNDPVTPSKSQNIYVDFGRRIGVDGLSAYEIAVRNGFMGTESDYITWLREPAVEAAAHATEIADGLEGRMTDIEESALYGDEVLEIAGVEVIADRATSDGDGNNIASTYQTKAAAAADKSELSVQINANTTAIVKKTEKVIPAVSGNLAGLTAGGNLEDSGITPASVARLDDKGELLSAQFNPLEGRQSGASLSGNSRYSLALPTPVLDAINSQSFSLEFLQTYTLASAPDGYTYLLASLSQLLSIYRQSTGVAAVQLYQKKEDGTYESTYTSLPLSTSTDTHHIVLSVDRNALLLKVCVDGSLFRALPFTTQASYNDAVSLIIGSLNAGGQPFVGHKFRLFNYALSDAEVQKLWNGGRPGEYMLPSAGALRTGLVAEYLPCGLLADKWRDTSGSGLDLEAVGTPKPSYEAVPDLSEITVDTGVFYTDIAEGVATKAINYPAGYIVERVDIYNYSRNNTLTGVYVLVESGWGGTTLIRNGTVHKVANTSYSVQITSFWPTMNYYSKDYPGTSYRVSVNATDNTIEGGMRVRVCCRWAGF